MFGIDPTFDGVSAHLDWTGDDVAQLLAIRDTNLRLHQIHSGDHFRDWMLHLNTRVHLDEVHAPIFVHEELNGAGILVADLSQTILQLFTNLFPQFWTDAGRWGFFEQLLMTPLNAAFALPESCHLTVLICEDLKFNVARTLNEFLHV